MSSETFSLENNNPFIHLTNHAVQQYGAGYGRHEAGNMRPFAGLLGYLPVDGRSVIDAQIRAIAASVFAKAVPKLNLARLPGCFELFGLDVILDDKAGCWLLEVNSNPSLDAATREVSLLKHRLVGNLN